MTGIQSLNLLLLRFGPLKSIFLLFPSVLQKRLRKNIEKIAKIMDFGLPKPCQNPSKMEASKIDVSKNMRFFMDFC